MRESGEMYLETLLVLGREKNRVRAVDIADRMGFSKPSVSLALAKLRGSGHIIVDQDGFIAMTESGHAIAEKIYERHTVISKLLMSLGVSEENAVADACKIEHDISDESFEAIKRSISRKAND